MTSLLFIQLEKLREENPTLSLRGINESEVLKGTNQSIISRRNKVERDVRRNLFEGKGIT